MKEKIKRLSPVLFLIPAVLVAVLIAFTLPDTVPVLRDIPERLTQVVQAKAVREEKEKARKQRKKRKKSKQISFPMRTAPIPDPPGATGEKYVFPSP